MAIVRYDPFGLQSLWRWPSVWEDENDSMMASGDGLDIYETDNEVVIRANVAGVDENKIDITFEKGVLWIRAAEDEEDKEGKAYYRKTSRSYSYKIAVPGNLDAKAEPEASVKNGVLELHFKKAEEAKPKKITVGKNK